MSLENDFLEAVSKNQVDEVQRILNLGDMINLQCRDGEGRTPLMISIQEGFLGKFESRDPKRLERETTPASGNQGPISLLCLP